MSIGWWDIVTGSLATVGAVLGVMNAWKAFVSDRLNLRVKVVYSFPVGMSRLPQRMIGVEVINLSNFPVTIVDVGLTIRGSSDRDSFAVAPIIPDGGPWPRRLESREAVALYADASGARPPEHYQYVYAKTACGEMVKATPTNL